jgi:acyl-CoA thioesterase-1
MKKFIVFSLLISGLFIGLLFIGCDDGGASDNEPVLVCFGDSLTAGYGATVPKVDDKSKSYPAYLQKKVTIPVINAGVSGNKTAQALSRVDDVLVHKPQIVIILLGANDLFEAVNFMDTAENLRNIIDTIDDGNRRIYLAKFYTNEVAFDIAESFLGGSVTEAEIQGLIDIYDAIFDDLTSPANVALIEDIWEGVWGVHMSDEVHPDAAGYEIMADNIFNAIESCLRTYGFLK